MMILSIILIILLLASFISFLVALRIMGKIEKNIKEIQTLTDKMKRICSSMDTY